MTPFTDDELIGFMLGRPTERAAEINRQAATDPELAAQLALMRAVSGVPEPPPPATLPMRPRATAWSRPLRRLTAAVVALFMLGSMSWAAWYALYTPPLLHDNFNDGWVNPLLWYSPRPIVREEKGHLALINRGYLRTFEEFPGPISLSFRWRWRDLAGWPTYADGLTVVLRTTGQPLGAHSHEAADGIAVRFDAPSGTININRMPLGLQSVLATTPEASVPFPAGEWHEIRITDDGEEIAVYVHGPAIPPQKHNEPILKVRCPSAPGPHHIVLYNRERLAEVPHESHIDDFILRRLP